MGEPADDTVTVADSPATCCMPSMPFWSISEIGKCLFWIIRMFGARLSCINFSCYLRKSSVSAFWTLLNVVWQRQAVSPAPLWGTAPVARVNVAPCVGELCVRSLGGWCCWQRCLALAHHGGRGCWTLVLSENPKYIKTCEKPGFGAPMLPSKHIDANLGWNGLS
jgi:hypothetical protein